MAGVYLTLRGKFGARSTRVIEGDAASSVLHIAAPILNEGQLRGVLTVAKPISSIQAIVERAQRKMLVQAAWLLALSAAVGAAVTLWIVWNIRRLRRYANAVQTDVKPLVPKLPGELGELAQAMEAMRLRLDAKGYIEAYVQALTHELKNPLTALHSSAELLQEPLPAADTQRFSAQVLAQSHRVQQLLKQLLELSKLDNHATLQRQNGDLAQTARSVAAHWFSQHQPSQALRFEGESKHGTAAFDASLITLGIDIVLHNAVGFSPAQSTILVGADRNAIWVQDQGVGLPEFVLDKLQRGERFFSTARPDGAGKGSGLGLAIVAQIMRLHGGQVRFDNQSPGLKVSLIFPTTA